MGGGLWCPLTITLSSIRSLEIQLSVLSLQVCIPIYILLMSRFSFNDSFFFSSFSLHINKYCKTFPFSIFRITVVSYLLFVIPNNSI